MGNNTHTPGGAPDAGEGNDPRLVALGHEGARTSRRVGDLETMLRQVAADVTSLAQVVDDAVTGSGEVGDYDAQVPQVRAWLLTADPEQAGADLADLISWLDRVHLTYHGATLPSCWMWHADVIEELWWLPCAHADAYDPKEGSWLRVGDWHDRQRPGVVKRIRVATHGCELALHVPGAERARRPAPAPLIAAAAAIAAWTAAGRVELGPEPTSAQLAEADTYHHTQHQSRR